MLVAIASFLSALAGGLVALIANIPTLSYTSYEETHTKHQNSVIAYGIATLAFVCLSLITPYPWFYGFMVASMPCSYLTMYYLVMEARIEKREPPPPTPEEIKNTSLDDRIDEILKRDRR